MHALLYYVIVQQCFLLINLLCRSLPTAVYHHRHCPSPPSGPQPPLGRFFFLSGSFLLDTQRKRGSRACLDWIVAARSLIARTAGVLFMAVVGLPAVPRLQRLAAASTLHTCSGGLPFSLSLKSVRLIRNGLDHIYKFLYCVFFLSTVGATRSLLRLLFLRMRLARISTRLATGGVRF